MRPFSSCLLAATLLFTASSARADDDAPAATHWYGYQTLATDGVALALSVPMLTSGSSATQQGFGVGSGLMFAVGAPIVHLSHGHVGKGLADLLMRVGMAAGGAVIGAGIGAAAYHPAPVSGNCAASATGSASEASGAAACDLGQAFAPVIGGLDAIATGMEIGGIVGVLGASAIDAIFLAKERATDATPAEAQPESEPPPPVASRARVEPAFGVAPEKEGGARATVGVIGTF